MMSKTFDYTSAARRFALRYPLLSTIGIQVNFWIIANIFLGLILHFQSMSISASYPYPTGITRSIVPGLIIAVFLGVLYGLALGLADYFIENEWFRKKSVGSIILLKALISFVVLVSLFSIIRYVVFDLVIAAISFEGVLSMNEKSWEYLFYGVMVFYFFMTLIISFINQINKKYGPGVLLPLLLGKYQTPQEVERIFLFMDLKSSTTIAEQLGHLRYSALIRDSFLDINHLLSDFNAEVYQYVGDEIVIFWRPDDGFKQQFCLKFFFACERQFMEKREYYTTNYGVVPHFKAGMHMGKVVAVEIGDVKRDIAYHGDTLNTAARIQSVCNQYNQKLLVSEYLLGRMEVGKGFRMESLGNVPLKGKLAPVGVVGVDEF